jgi:hypothetical protein
MSPHSSCARISAGLDLIVPVLLRHRTAFVGNLPTEDQIMIARRMGEIWPPIAPVLREIARHGGHVSLESLKKSIDALDSTPVDLLMSWVEGLVVLTVAKEAIYAASSHFRPTGSASRNGS